MLQVPFWCLQRHFTSSGSLQAHFSLPLFLVVDFLHHHASALIPSQHINPLVLTIIPGSTQDAGLNRCNYMFQHTYDFSIH